MKRPVNTKKQNRIKALEAKAKTVGDWLKSKRMAKKLMPYHVAEKMGIATELVLAWEGDISTPNEQQWHTLSKLLAFDMSAIPPAETHR